MILTATISSINVIPRVRRLAILLFHRNCQGRDRTGRRLLELRVPQSDIGESDVGRPAAYGLEHKCRQRSRSAHTTGTRGARQGKGRVAVVVLYVLGRGQDLLTIRGHQISGHDVAQPDDLRIEGYPEGNRE